MTVERAEPHSRWVELLSLTTLVVSAIVVFTVSSAGSEPDRSGTDEFAAVVSTVRIDYRSGERVTPRGWEAGLGHVVYLTVTSDVAVKVAVEGYETEDLVAAGGSTTLVLSADRAGTYDIDVVDQERAMVVGRLVVR